MSAPCVYTIGEVAAMFRVSPNTIRRAIDRGDIPVVQVLSVRRIPATALPAALTVPHDPAAAVAGTPRGSAAAAGVPASGVAGSLPGEQTPGNPND